MEGAEAQHHAFFISTLHGDDGQFHVPDVLLARKAPTDQEAGWTTQPV
jgi:hypothetical protein